MPTYDEIFEETEFHPLADVEYSYTDPVLYVHSSGQYLKNNFAFDGFAHDSYKAQRLCRNLYPGHIRLFCKQLRLRVSLIFPKF